LREFFCPQKRSILRLKRKKTGKKFLEKQGFLNADGFEIFGFLTVDN